MKGLALALVLLSAMAEARAQAPAGAVETREPRAEARSPSTEARSPSTEAREPKTEARSPSTEPVVQPGPPEKFELAPSAYDRALALEGKPPEAESLAGQAVKTLLALGAVIGLIYLLFRVGLAKLMPGMTAARTGKIVRIVERVAVDQRSSLLVIDVGNSRMLVGAGEGGMQVLAQLDPRGDATPSAPPSRPFQTVLDTFAGKSTNEDADAPK